MELTLTIGVQGSVPLLAVDGRKMKEMCIYWNQADGVHGDCLHPEGPRGQCVLSYADECALKEESETCHTCEVCGNIMSSEAYDAKGCIFCGANSEPMVCLESYDVRDRE